MAFVAGLHLNMVLPGIFERNVLPALCDFPQSESQSAWARGIVHHTVTNPFGPMTEKFRAETVRHVHIATETRHANPFAQLNRRNGIPQAQDFWAVQRPRAAKGQQARWRLHDSQSG